MKEQAIEIASRTDDPVMKTNLLREYLQACALRSLHESKAFQNLSFVGGTALRFLYRLPRFSEDLDFSLENADDYNPKSWMGKLKREFEYYGFNTEVTWNDRKTVNVAWVKVAGLLFEAGIVDRTEHNLSIKLEIDTKPPKGAVMETRLVNRHMIFAIRHHDLPSLMAGKIRALLTRPFQKGRDWYDLVWYLSMVPPVIPNATLLMNALAQPSEVNYYKPGESWQTAIAGCVSRLDVGRLLADVEPFLERPEEAALLTGEHIGGLLTRE